ncbi:MAG: YigZ family protein [Erysipelotrichaceae bacterium]|nr:YigZ family protein [Erysipelotrichaceae bacterium]
MRIKENLTNTIIIQRSEFITYLFRVFTEAEAREKIKEVRKMHGDATHVCTAFITDNRSVQRSNDDGEPAGTAGMPMLDALKKNDMEDILACTVRYFGGIKLGAGGLVRAYSSSVADALKLAIKTEKVILPVHAVTFSYDAIGKIDYLFKNINVLDKDYGTEVTYLYATQEDMSQKLQEITSGKAIIEFIENREEEIIV